ncbi:MAG: hypothetical protein RMA76_31675 [Deltaproteobacteria bacterium]|jgi:hypothetical protein
MKKRLCLIALVCGAAGCMDELPSYNEIEGFRLLAVGADKPWILPEETAEMSVLLASDTSTTTGVTFDWSWCPFTSGSAGGYECAVTRDELQAQIDMFEAPVPIVVPPFELGTTATVGFTYPFDELVVQGFCDALTMIDDVPAFVSIPSCDNRLPITIRVEVSNGTERIVAVKEVQLVFGFGAEVNTNPVATGMSASLDTNEDGEGDGETLDLDTPQTLERSSDYALTLDLTEAQSQSFTREDPATMMDETVREVLTVTWFVRGGELDSGRTGFIDGQVPIDIAQSNVWSIPAEVDFEDDTAEVIVVVRDGRGGTSWLRRTVRLQ